MTSSQRARSFRFLAQAFWLVASLVWTAVVLDMALSAPGKSRWFLKLLGGSDKLLHAAAFTVGGIVWVKSIETVARLRHWAAVAVGAAISLAIGAAIEIAQRYVPSRSSDFKDFLADIAGVLLALVLLSLYAALHSAKASSRLDSHGITK